jgi:putative acetyltransferase
MLRLKRTDSTDQDFHLLVKLLDKELWVRYEAEQASYEKHNKIENNNTVVIAYEHDQPVACGCFKKIDDATAEVKRMFVIESQRGKGISKLIMRELEQWATTLSFKRMILETGFKQPEAIALYKKAGYTQIENYEPYVGMSGSLCMEKKLA